MPNNYDIIQQLIGYLQQFESQADAYTFEEFTKWFINEIQNSGSHDIKVTIQTKSSKDQQAGDNNKSDTQQQFLSMISRLSKCQDFYAKKFFYGLPINTLLEYNFLFTLNKGDALKKMDLINMLMVEYTTGIDVLKRLNRLNLVSEYRDVADKRNKRIHITSEGKRILIDLMLRMNKLYEVFLGCVSKKAWTDSLGILGQLNEFHNKIFIQYNSKTYSEIIQHIDRLNTKTSQGNYQNVDNRE